MLGKRLSRGQSRNSEQFRQDPLSTILAKPTMAVSIFVFLIVVLVARRVSRALCRLLQREKPNFRGDRIPASAGLTHLLTASVAYAVPVWPEPLRRWSLLFGFVALCFGLLGFADDLWGSRAVGGFRGHIRALLQGRPTTGSVKLVGGGLAALVAAILVDGFRPSALLDAAVIALGANTLNLLDVRPGRAQFGFALLCAAPLVGGGSAAFALLAPLLLSAGAEWRDDARARAMMGDTGSNLLGACAGLAACLFLPFWSRAVLLVFLIALNLASERFSFTALIERTPWLRALDRHLGVRDFPT